MKMKFRYLVDVEIDADDWMLEYGLDAEEVEKDAIGLLPQVMRARLEGMTTTHARSVRVHPTAQRVG